MHHWLLIVFTALDKSNIARVYRHRTIRSIAGVVGETTTVVSNTVHGLILPRGCLRYCDIRKVEEADRMPLKPRAGRHGVGVRPLCLPRLGAPAYSQRARLPPAEVGAHR